MEDWEAVAFESALAGGLDNSSKLRIRYRKHYSTNDSSFSGPICWSTKEHWSTFFNNNLTQLIDKPTHIKHNILDHIITNTSHRTQEISISSHNRSMHSDHIIITFKVTHSVLPQPQTSPHYVLNFPKADYYGLCSYLMDLSWLHSTLLIWWCTFHMVIRSMYISANLVINLLFWKYSQWSFKIQNF